MASINAIKEIFPGCELKCCFFHLSQNVFRKIQELCLQIKYQQDENFAIKAKIIPALAFIPERNVIEAFELLQETLTSEFDDLLAYFEDKYIGRIKRSRRVTPQYPVNLWNMYERTNSLMPRTNNYIEGWHNKMQSAVSCHHPNIWKFLDILQEEHRLNMFIANQVKDGHEQQSSKKYCDYNARLVIVIGQYLNLRLLPYLRTVAINLRL